MGSLRTALAGVVGRFASDRPNGKERFHKTRHLIRQLRVSLDYADYGQATLLRASCFRCAPSGVMNSRRLIQSPRRRGRAVGSVRPSDVAVLRLMTSVTLVVCWTRQVGGLLALKNPASINAG